MPQQMVPIDIDGAPQRYALHLIEMNGERAVLLMINSPMSVQAVAFTRDAALKMADELRTIFGALTIATDLPPTNGQAQT